MFELFPNVKVHYQLSAALLIEQTLSRNEGVLSSTGALVIHTGKFTDRSPSDKFIVKDVQTEITIDWNKFNNPFDEGSFLELHQEMLAYLQNCDEVWIRDAYVCADPAYHLSIRMINENPWANLFGANMFIAPGPGEQEYPEPEWTIIHAPGFNAVPAVHRTREENFAVISFKRKTILIGGSAYPGEIKKAVFTVLNYILPLQHDVLSMHCSANEGAGGDTALFFGLSGTGKTTLSTEPTRGLIGDDQHGWSSDGIFNFEGGCYAKIVNLSPQHEPDIFQAIRFGALVENTTFIEGTDQIDFKNITITENTRVSYPLGFIDKAKVPSIGASPENIFLLTCDAYGILPPVSRLTHNQALFYFISGYTAKIAGTEQVIKEPQATFSTCFGAPFLPLNPAIYANLFLEKIQAAGSKVWMINTGWTCGPYGVGKRIGINYSRAMVTAACNGDLEAVEYLAHPQFGMLIPQFCPSVPRDILNPWQTWTNKIEYQHAAEALAKKFNDNFTQFASDFDWCQGLPL